VFGEGVNGCGRGCSEDKHNNVGADGSALFGAVDVLPVAGSEEGVEDVGGETVHSRLQAGLRALLHPRRRKSGVGRVAEESGAERVAHGALQNDAPPLREHLQQFPLVRARLHGGQGSGREGGPGLADRIRVGFQVQQRRLEGRAGHAGAK